MEIRDILTENCDLIPELERSISEAKTHVLSLCQCKFLAKLEEEITKDCSIKRCDRVEDGITFKIPRGELSKMPFEVGLRVEVDHSGRGVWYGFVILENGLRIEKCAEKRFEEYVTLVHNVLNTDYPLESRLGCEFLKYKGQQIGISDFETEQMRYIVEDDELEKMVDAIAQEIKDAVDKFIKAKEDAGL